MNLLSGHVKLAFVVGFAVATVWLAPTISSWMEQRALAEVEQYLGVNEVCFVDLNTNRQICAANARDVATVFSVDIATAMQSR
jgi:hypothetical protein